MFRFVLFIIILFIYEELRNIQMKKMPLNKNPTIAPTILLELLDDEGGEGHDEGGESDGEGGCSVWN
ncbi:unnamed protein product [Rhizophagus irregularis]|nr:unnamed protein product [Rhizophagus irregularis]